MLAASTSGPFDDPDKLFEVKWDGIRAIAVIREGQVRITTRGNKDITQAFPDVASNLLNSVTADGLVLDGELIAVDDDGIPRLHRVMERWHQSESSRNTVPVSFEVFDILYRDGKPLLREPLYKRKHHLAACLKQNAQVHICHYEEGGGVSMFEAARSLGLEGIVAKDRNSPYQPGKRSKHWLKIKHSRTANLVVGGYTFGGGVREALFGSLLLGAYQGNKLRFIGSVVGGFTKQDRQTIYAAISQLHTDESPFTEAPIVDKFLFWCEPAIVVQVNYGEFTQQRHLRFPIFSTLRPDIDARDCTFDAIARDDY